jgi:hypothetical protein
VDGISFDVAAIAGLARNFARSRRQPSLAQGVKKTKWLKKRNPYQDALAIGVCARLRKLGASRPHIRRHPTLANPKAGDLDIDLSSRCSVVRLIPAPDPPHRFLIAIALRVAQSRRNKESLSANG